MEKIRKNTKNKRPRGTWWFYASVVLSMITVVFYVISFSYTIEYSIDVRSLKFYATIDTWIALLTLVICFVSIIQTKGWGRIMSVLLFILCSYFAYSAALMAALSQVNY